MFKCLTITWCCIYSTFKVIKPGDWFRLLRASCLDFDPSGSGSKYLIMAPVPYCFWTLPKILSTYNYTPDPKERGYTVLPLSLFMCVCVFVCPCFCVSIINFFLSQLLSNYLSHWLEILTHSSCRFAVWLDTFFKKFAVNFLFTKDFVYFLLYFFESWNFCRPFLGNYSSQLEILRYSSCK